MKQNLKLLLLIVCSFTFINSKSQTTYTPSIVVDSLHAWGCGNENLTPSKYNFISNQNATYRAALLPTPANFVIPVVVHVLYDAAHANDPAKNISYQQIQWQISALNTGFQNFYGSAMPNATNTQIQFCLAQIPMGPAWTNSAQPGVMRYQVPTAVLNHTIDVPGQNSLLATTHSNILNFPFENYLNIWLVDSIYDTTGVAAGGLPNRNIIGYSNFPNTLTATNLIDGIVIHNNVFGSNLIPNNQNTLFSGLDQGGILVHEAGHYLNLLHTFQGSTGLFCAGTTTANCLTQGDLICDTPPTKLTNIAVCTVTSTCVDNLTPIYATDQNDFVNNFMCYSDDNCLNAFTAGQSAVMQGVLSTAWPIGRQDMTSPANLAATGLTGSFGCCPTGVTTAYFTTTPLGCSAITFSCIVPPCGMNVNYTMNFGDGVIVSGTNSTITHTYNLPGQYTPTLTVTGGSVTVSWSKVVEVGSYGKSSAKTVCNNSFQGVKFHIQSPVTNGTYLMTSNVNGILSTHTFSVNSWTQYAYGHANSTNIECHIPVNISSTVTLPAQIIYTVTLTGANICPVTFIDTFNVTNCCNNIVTNGNFSNGTNGFTLPSGNGVVSNGQAWLQWPFIPSLNFDSPLCGVPSTCTRIAVYNTNIPLVSGTNYHFNFQCFGGQPTNLYHNGHFHMLDTLFLNPRILDNSGNIIRDFGNIAIMDLSDSTWNHYDFIFNNPSFTGTGQLNIAQVKNFYSIDNVFQHGAGAVGWGYDYSLDELNIRAIAPTFTAAITPSITSICSGQNISLMSSAANSYSWNTGATTNSISVTPTITSTYSVLATSILNCTATANSTINVTATPNLSVTPSSTICTGNSITLSASGATTYSWNTGATTSSISVTPSVTTIYSVTGTNSGCSNTKTISVTVNQTPTVSVNNTTICLGQTATLTASGAVTYSWSTGATTSTISITPSTTTVYTVTGTKTGCTNTKTATVTVNPSPTVTAVTNPISICVGQTATLTAGGAISYTWSTSSTNTVITVSPSVTTTYSVTGTNTFGCSSTKTISVIVGPVTPTLTANSTTVNVCGGNTATLTGSGATNYTWSPISVYTSTAAVTPTAAIIYTLSGNYGVGCNTATTTLLVNPVISTLCCTAANSSITTSTIVAGAYSAGTIIDVSGVITFTGNTSYTGYTFRMKPGAKLRVVYERTLTLTNCKVFSCSELWDGIYLEAWNNDVHGHLTLNNTTVEDMYNGIVVEGNNHAVVTPTTGLLINSTASKLNKNYISIQFRNLAGMLYTPTMTYTNTPYPFSMITTTVCSYSTTTSPGSTLKPSSTYTYAYNTWAGGASSSTNPPFLNFPRTFIGVSLNNMSTPSLLVIGDSTTAGNTNVFDNMDFGIKGVEASAKVHNNYFKNITGSKKQTTNGETYPAFGPDEIGIAVAMTHTSTNVHALTVGTHTVLPSSTAYPKGNKFEDCNRGVYAIGCSNVYAKANSFSATATSTVPAYGVDAYYYYKNQSAIWINAQADLFTLSYNYIRNFSSGIYSSHTTTNTSMRPHIAKNDIAAPSSTGFCKQAIQVAQVGGSNFTNGYINIDGNAIANVYNGIQAGGIANGVLIKNNSVSVEPTTKSLAITATTIRTAIRVSNSTYAMIQANSVTNGGAVPTTSTTANYITGIHVSGSTNTKVECNNAYHTGRGFVFEGACGNSSWKVNTMSDSYRGLEMRLAAVIGQQGGTGSPNLSANTWTTLTQHTFVLGTTNVNTASKLYLLAGGNTQPTLNFAVTAAQAYTTGVGQGIQPTTGTSYTCNAGNAQRLANSDNGSNANSGGNNQKTAGAETDSLTELTNLATADEDSYEVFAEEMMYQNKQFVYELIEQDSINPSKNSILSAFYNNNQNTAIDRLTEAQIAIANFDISGASAANSSAPVTSAIEQKQQRVNELVLKYMNDRNYVFTDAEKSELKNMANECEVKGDYVTHARNLVDVFTHTTILYDDECETEANASRKKKAEDIVNNNTLFNLFPNPNNGTMQLDYKLGNYSTAKFNLYDITGKLIQTKTLETNEGSLYINEQNLTNGVYFYTILVGEKNIKTDKIVIIK